MKHACMQRETKYCGLWRYRIQIPVARDGEVTMDARWDANDYILHHLSTALHLA
jgi:hypothetical protein